MITMMFMGLACADPVAPLDPVLDAENQVVVAGRLDISSYLSTETPGSVAVVLSLANSSSGRATIEIPGCSFMLLGYDTPQRTSPPVYRQEAPGPQCGPASEVSVQVDPHSSRTFIVTRYNPSEVFAPESGVTELWLRFRIAGERRSRELWLTAPAAATHIGQ